MTKSPKNQGKEHATFDELDFLLSDDEMYLDDMELDELSGADIVSAEYDGTSDGYGDDRYFRKVLLDS